MQKLTYYSLLVIFGLFSISCDSDNNPIPDNVIQSPTGLNIDLEWSTGGSAVQSLTDADLDLFVYSGPDDVAFSGTTEFERVRLENFFRNDTYIIAVEYFGGVSNVNWSLFIGGLDADNTIIINDSFSRNDVGISLEYIEIIKNGTTYTVNLLN